MKKKYSHHAIKDEGVRRVTPITSEWVNMVIATTIGPNIALYSMSDPEGPKRMDMFKEAIKNFIADAYVKLAKEPDFDPNSFVRTAQSIIFEHFGNFTRERFAHLLTNGMPSKPVIIKPH